MFLAVCCARSSWEVYIKPTSNGKGCPQGCIYFGCAAAIAMASGKLYGVVVDELQVPLKTKKAPGLLYTGSFFLL